MGLVSLSEIVDKTMVAAKNINVRRLPRPDGEVLQVIKKGDTIGRVYTWVTGNGADGKKDGSYWLSYYERYGDKKLIGYTKIQEGFYNIKDLRDQGVKTVAERTKEKEEKEKEDTKTWYEKLLEKLGEGGKKILTVGAVVFVVVKLGQTLIITQSNKNAPKQIEN